MQEFRIVLKNDREIVYGAFAWIIIFLNLLLFAKVAYTSVVYLGIGGIVSFVLCFFVMYAMQKSSFDITRALFLISIVFWTIAGFTITSYFWFALISIILLILYTVSGKVKIVFFKETGIIYPSFPPKNIYWNEVSQTILKDGLLTIDLKKNLLIQQLVDGSRTSVNEKEFNDFCSQQLKK